MAVAKDWGWMGREGGRIRTVMEAAKGPPYRLVWQVLFCGELLSTLDAMLNQSLLKGLGEGGG
jgi:hypothetical protein